MDRAPKISIITPSFNCARYITRCIESVLRQGYPAFEHLIADNQSQDGTLDILKRYPHLRWCSEPDRGEADALNKALKIATGDVVCWLNADDWMMDGVLSAVGAAFRSHPERRLIYGNTFMIDEHDRLLWVKKSDPAVDLAALARWWNCRTHPHQPSIFFKRDLMLQVGPFNELLHFSIDYEYWLRCARVCKFHHLDLPLSCALQRAECKSGGTETKQVQSHWNVLMPFLEYLSPQERVSFWEDYYTGRLSGLEGCAKFEETRLPSSREAAEGLVRTCRKAPTEEVLSTLFPDRNRRNELGHKLRELAAAPG